MRGLLVLGCIALGVILVTASPKDQVEPEVEAKDEGEQGEFVNKRDIRSTGSNKNKTKSRLKTGVFSSVGRAAYIRDKRNTEKERKRCPECYSPVFTLGEFVNKRDIRSTGNNKNKSKPRLKTGLFSALSKAPSTRDKRNTEKERKRCPGCYSPVFTLKEDGKILTPVSRQQRDAEGQEKLKRKHKDLKEESHTKRRRHKDNKDRHAHFQAEDPEIGHNHQKRRKHHRGKDRGHHRAGSLTALGMMPPSMEKMNMDIPDRQRPHHKRKYRGQHRTGSFTALELMPPDIKKMGMEIPDRQRPHHKRKYKGQHRTGSFTALELMPPDIKKMDTEIPDRQEMTK